MQLESLIGRYNELHPRARIETVVSKGQLALALSGELEMKVSSDLAPLVEAALLECPARGRLVLDLSGVEYISSTGVGLLATTMVAAEGRAITFVLLDVPERVRGIMDTLGLLSFFNVEVSRAEG